MQVRRAVEVCIFKCGLVTGVGELVQKAHSDHWRNQAGLHWP